MVEASCIMINIHKFGSGCLLTVLFSNSLIHCICVCMFVSCLLYVFSPFVCLHVRSFMCCASLWVLSYQFFSNIFSLIFIVHTCSIFTLKLNISLSSFDNNQKEISTSSITLISVLEELYNYGRQNYNTVIIIFDC